MKNIKNESLKLEETARDSNVVTVMDNYDPCGPERAPRHAPYALQPSPLELWCHSDSRVLGNHSSKESLGPCHDGGEFGAVAFLKAYEDTGALNR